MHHYRIIYYSLSSVLASVSAIHHVYSVFSLISTSHSFSPNLSPRILALIFSPLICYVALQLMKAAVCFVMLFRWRHYKYWTDLVCVFLLGLESAHSMV